MQLLILDNYDSFTYNLQDYFARLGVQAEVFRNDAISVEAVSGYDAVVLSPGPGLPKDAGIMPALIERFFREKPILGICLGHQALSEHFGGRLLNLPEVLHGRQMTSEVTISDSLFSGIPKSFLCGHYHSWVVDPKATGVGIEVIAKSTEGHVMALRHSDYPLYGMQFHPESVMTPMGLHILENWVKLARLKISFS